MSALTKRTTIYLEPELHQALRLQARVTSRSISDLVNTMIRAQLAEDAADLKSFRERAEEPVISYEQLLADLQAQGKR